MRKIFKRRLLVLAGLSPVRAPGSVQTLFLGQKRPKKPHPTYGVLHGAYAPIAIIRAHCHYGTLRIILTTVHNRQATPNTSSVPNSLRMAFSSHPVLGCPLFSAFLCPENVVPKNTKENRKFVVFGVDMEIAGR